MTAKKKPVQHAVLTGPITGTVTLSDGTEVDVSPEVVYVATVEAAEQVAHAVGQHYADAGHPTDPNYTYQPPEGA